MLSDNNLCKNIVDNVFNIDLYKSDNFNNCNKLLMQSHISPFSMALNGHLDILKKDYGKLEDYIKTLQDVINKIEENKIKNENPKILRLKSRDNELPEHLDKNDLDIALNSLKVDLSILTSVHDNKKPDTGFKTNKPDNGIPSITITNFELLEEIIEGKDPELSREILLNKEDYEGYLKLSIETEKHIQNNKSLINNATRDQNCNNFTRKIGQDNASLKQKLSQYDTKLEPLASFRKIGTKYKDSQYKKMEILVPRFCEYLREVANGRKVNNDKIKKFIEKFPDKNDFTELANEFEKKWNEKKKTLESLCSLNGKDGTSQDFILGLKISENINIRGRKDIMNSIYTSYPQLEKLPLLSNKKYLDGPLNNNPDQQERYDNYQKQFQNNNQTYTDLKDRSPPILPTFDSNRKRKVSYDSRDSSADKQPVPSTSQF